MKLFELTPQHLMNENFQLWSCKIFGKLELICLNSEKMSHIFRPAALTKLKGINNKYLNVFLV